MDAPPPPARGGTPPWRFLIVAGALLLALGGWRLAVGIAGQPDRYFLLSLRNTDEEIAKVEAGMAQAEASLEAGRETQSRAVRTAEEANLRNLRQIHDAMVLHREQDLRLARDKELKTGVIVAMLGLVLLGLGVRSLVRAPRALAPSRTGPR